MKRNASGFTLIEIAIVLVIIGLLLGGVLKGQELITGARVRNLISQQDGIKAAFFGFQDRYRALPGDYAAADKNLNCGTSITCPVGNGNGRVENPATSTGTIHEELIAWNHLTAAGFLNGNYTYTAETAPSDATNPKNPYSSYLELAYDGVYGTGTTATPLTAKHNLKTGAQVPVEIVSEVDRKIDDGLPYAGGFQFSLYSAGGTGTAPTVACVAGTPPAAVTWALSGTQANCGGSSLF
ncbi:MAG: prepilin-type N-terminal cleavage/methylation domain-containing protein [Betaproteobacteria bacterium]